MLFEISKSNACIYVSGRIHVLLCFLFRFMLFFYVSYCSDRLNLSRIIFTFEKHPVSRTHCLALLPTK